MVEQLKPGDRGICARCRERAVLVHGAEGLCRAHARALAVELITKAGPPEPATNRVLVTQEK